MNVDVRGLHTLLPVRKPNSRRFYVVLAVLALATVVLGAVLGSEVLIRSFRQIEAESMQQKAQQMYRALVADFAQMAIDVRDYAEWDDALDFVATGNPQFISANFTKESFLNMHLDAVRVIGAQGETLYSAQLDRDAEQLQTPADPDLLQALQRGITPTSLQASNAEAARLVATPRGLAAVTARRITHTDRTGGAGAVMLFARIIGLQELERLRETSQLPVQFIDLTARERPALSPVVQQWLAQPDETPLLTTTRDQAQVYVRINGVDGRTLALLTTVAPRNILALGLRTVWFVVAVIAAVIAAFGAIAMGLLWRLQRSYASQRASEERYRLIAAQLHEAIVLVDAESFAVVDANDVVLQALGCRSNEIYRKRVADVFPGIGLDALTSLARSHERALFASRLGSKPDALQTEVAVTPVELAGRRLLSMVGRDISDRLRSEERERENRRKLLQVAEHDSLTQLPNRLFLQRRLAQAMRKLATGDRLLALIYIDIDHFKNINDSLGHGRGDKLLQVLAKRLRAALGEQDLLARTGGDEFVVVAPLLLDEQAVERKAELLLTAVRAPVVLDGESLAVTASVGVALYPRDALDPDTLLKYADIALYEAKGAGRDCFRQFSAQLDVRVSEEVAMEQALRHAKDTDQIYVDYQPIIDLRTGRVASLEALMRWRHPTMGQVPPSQFVPVAEKTGLIVELGESVVYKVVARLKDWLRDGVPIVPITINVSPLQFDRGDFDATVARIAGAAGVDPKWLGFEITETAAMKERDRLIGTLGRLRELGSRILLDDFGTGFSNLSYLNQLPINTIKIDRSFVVDLDKQSRNRSVIHAVVDIARRLQLTVVVEGVETIAQAELVKEFGCDYAQGFLYSKPVSARHCRALLEELRRDRPLTETMLVRTVPEDFSVSTLRPDDLPARLTRTG